MGIKLSIEQAKSDPKKIEQINAKHEALKKQINQTQYIKGGNTVAASDSLILLSGNQSQETLLNIVSKTLQTQQLGEYNWGYEIIAIQLYTQYVKTLSTGVAVQEFKVYPIMTKSGIFSMAYASFYMERVAIHNGHSSEQQVAMVNAFKITTPPKPKTKQQVLEYVLSAGVYTGQDAQLLTEAIWYVMQNPWALNFLQTFSIPSK